MGEVQLRAACHKAVEAVAYAETVMKSVLPVGKRVKVAGPKPWTGTVAAYCLPFDGTLSVKPDDAGVVAECFLNRYGAANVHVDDVEVAI